MYEALDDVRQEMKNPLKVLGLGRPICVRPADDDDCLVDVVTET